VQKGFDRGLKKKQNQNQNEKQDSYSENQNVLVSSLGEMSEGQRGLTRSKKQNKTKNKSKKKLIFQKAAKQYRAKSLALQTKGK
jgi:hypothetical protein